MLSWFLAAGGVIDTANRYFGERQQRSVPCSRTCSRMRDPPMRGDSVTPANLVWLGQQPTMIGRRLSLPSERVN